MKILEHFFNTISALCMFGVWFITFLQVLSRYVLARPIGSSLEMISVAFLGLIFIGSVSLHANSVKGEQGHLGFDSIIIYTKGKLRFALELLTEIALMAFFALMMVSGVAAMINSWTSVLPLTGISRGWKYIFTPMAGFGMFLLSAQKLYNMINKKTKKLG